MTANGTVPSSLSPRDRGGPAARRARVSGARRDGCRRHGRPDGPLRSGRGGGAGDPRRRRPGPQVRRHGRRDRRGEEGGAGRTDQRSGASTPRWDASSRPRPGPAAPGADPARIFRVVDSPEHRAVAEEIARRSLTLLREGAGALPLTPGRRVMHLVVADTLDPKVASDMSRELRRRLEKQPETFTIDNRSNETDVRTVLEGRRPRRRRARLPVRSLSDGPRLHRPARRWRSPCSRSCAPPGLRSSRSRSGRRTSCATCRSSQTYVAAYGGQPVTQVAAARALFGEAAFSGRLPVTIPGAAARGDGIQKPAVPMIAAFLLAAVAASSPFEPRRSRRFRVHCQRRIAGRRRLDREPREDSPAACLGQPRRPAGRSKP